MNNNVKIGDCFVRNYSTGSCRMYMVEDVNSNDVRGLCIYVSKESFSREKFLFTHDAWGYNIDDFKPFSSVDFNIIKFIIEQYDVAVKDLHLSYIDRLHKILK